MDGENVFFVSLTIFIAAFLIVLAIIFVPLSVAKDKALTNLYNAAAEGKASGVIINISKE